MVRFHLIKQDDAIKRFIDLMESKRFVNPQSRVDIFSNLKDEQIKIFNERMDLVNQLNSCQTPNLSKDFVNAIAEKLKQINDDAQNIFDDIVDKLNKDMENTNEDADLALYDLKDFLSKNDA